MAAPITPNSRTMGPPRDLSSFSRIASIPTRRPTAHSTPADPELRQITRAEIKPLENADAQTTGAAQETGTTSGAQGASVGTSETSAPSAQTTPAVTSSEALSPVESAGSTATPMDTGTGSLVNTTDAATSLNNDLKTWAKTASMDRGTGGLINATDNGQAPRSNMPAGQGQPWRDIKSIDISEESSQLAKHKVLQDAGAAMLPNVHQLPQGGVMKLLG